MIFILNTGSITVFVVAKLSYLFSTGQLSNIIGIPTSKHIEKQALSFGIPFSILHDNRRLDLAIDGTTEVDLTSTL
ncbi:putative ribose-5-phosphate isomerase 3 [Arachis hypogaea]|nr:putative ribose-5-phosphate isomerase 3 [Arachis hypogaea]